MVTRRILWTAIRVMPGAFLLLLVGAWRAGVDDVNVLSAAGSFPVVHPQGCFHTKPQLGVAPVICVKPDSEDQIITHTLKMTGEWEGGLVTEVLRAVTRHPGFVFVDLGSNLGVYSLTVAAMLRARGEEGPGRVIAVDAMATNLAYIRASLLAANASTNQITLVNNAVSDTVAPLYPVIWDIEPGAPDNPKTNPGSIRFVPAAEAGTKALGPFTLSTTLPSILSRLVPPGATVIIKMDIQGAECRTLMAPGLFSTGHHLPWILMEWGVGVLRPHTCPSLPDLLDLLEGHGYRAVWPASLRAMPRHCLGSPWPEVLWIQTHGEQAEMEECEVDDSKIPWREPGPRWRAEEGRVVGVNTLQSIS